MESENLIISVLNVVTFLFQPPQKLVLFTLQSAVLRNYHYLIYFILFFWQEHGPISRKYISTDPRRSDGEEKIHKGHCFTKLILQMSFLSLPHSKASQLYKPVGI